MEFESCWPLALTLIFVGTWTGQPAESFAAEKEPLSKCHAEYSN